MAGKIILLFARDSKNILKLESVDEGVTWGSVVDITSMVMDPTWSSMDTGPPGGIQLPSGRLLVCTYSIMHYLYHSLVGTFCLVPTPLSGLFNVAT